MYIGERIAIVVMCIIKMKRDVGDDGAACPGEEGWLAPNNANICVYIIIKTTSAVRCVAR